MKNNELKPFKQPKNKQKLLALVFGSALAFCSILAPFTAYKANADVVDNGATIPDVAFNDYYRHPLGGFSISCFAPEDEGVDVFDCPATYGGNETFFSNRLNLPYYSSWQNTFNGTFTVENLSGGDFVASNVFQLVGLNVALVEEHTQGDWCVNVGQFQYDITVQYKPIYNSGEPSDDYYRYDVIPTYWNDGNYVFNFSELFAPLPNEVYSNNGTALFDWIAITFNCTLAELENPVITFYDPNDNGITMAQYAGRVNSLYNWIYNGSPIETILKFPIDFLNTEIFPDFSFGTVLLIALGVMVFSLGLKIAFGG